MRGKAEALNFAVADLEEEFYVGIDADTVIAADAVSKLVCHFADPQIGAVAGNAKVGNRVNLWTRWQALEYITSQNFERRALDLFNVVTVVPGAIGAWRTEAVRQGGCYPVNTVAEDADLTMNLLEQGYKVIYEDRALAFTEAPATARGLMRQRFRWSFGTLQAVYKHQAAFLKNRAMGLFALPNILVFQILLPLVSPFIDLMFVAGVVHYLLDRHFHPEAANAANFEKLLTFFLAFLIIDFVTSALAFSLERRHRGQQGRRLAALPYLAAAFCLSPTLFAGAVQDGEAGHRWTALQLGQAGTYGKDVGTDGAAHRHAISIFTNGVIRRNGTLRRRPAKDACTSQRSPCHGFRANALKSKIVVLCLLLRSAPSFSLLRPAGSSTTNPSSISSDFENVHSMQAALTRVGDMLGHEYELVIGGQRSRTPDKIESLNPARPAQVVGVHQKAGLEHAERAMQAALEAFATWQYVAVEERAALLLQTAELIRKRKFEFCAWLTYEVGKNWVEADADVAETIDFLEFYAREALRLAEATTPIQYPGERNQLRYIPVGVCAVIPPWNFPFAIMAGMTAAAIVTGNTVILKPSSDSPTIAARFLDVLEEAGMPPGVVNFCPGSGSTFGNAIVEHPKTRLIAFTGSKDVGLDIHARAAQTKKGRSGSSAPSSRWAARIRSS